MPLLKLPPFTFFGKKTAASTAPADTFLCMMFVNHSIQAALWKVAGEKIETLAQSSIKTFENDEDGLIQADQTLQELGAESEAVSEVVFGFDPQWVDEAGLLAEKKPFIKNLTESLGLKPVGFVVITDALVQQILAKDSLASEVLVYIEDAMVSIFLLKQGKLVDQLAVGRSGDIVQDIIEGLARFAKQLTGKDAFLPAKLVLASAVLSAGEMDDAQQQIMDYDWSEHHPFVQAPVVETMAGLDVLYSVVEQGGAAAAASKGLKMTQGSDTPSPTGEEQLEAEDFGFESVNDVPKGDNFVPPVRQVTSFGVPISAKVLPDVSEPIEEPVVQSPSSKFRTKRTITMPGFLKKLSHWYNHHPHKKMILGGFVGGLAALILLSIGWVVRSYQVAISVQLAEKVITKDVAILIDPTAIASNPAKQILKASLDSVQVDGQDSVDTTGVKLVGDRAKGTVTILNKTKAVKTFTAGTKLTSGQLAFLLDNDVTVASASDQGTSLTYAQADAPVTANAIGADSNIAKDVALTIASFSTDTYSAKAKDAFSGGSSREVRVVSADDQAAVLKKLKTTLIADAGKKLTDKSSSGTYYIPTSVAKVLKEAYDAKVGEEADKVTLDLSLDVSGVVYHSEDLRPILVEALKADIPAGYQLIDEEPQFLSNAQQEATNSTKVTLDANVTAKARPPFDPNTTIQSILGLPLKDLNGTLSERSEIDQAKYSLRPGIAQLFVHRVPKTSDRVILEITNQFH